MVFLECDGQMVVFLVAPVNIQIVQDLLDKIMIMICLNALGPNKCLKPLQVASRYLETHEHMVNVCLLIWTVPEPLVNAMNFLYSIAEMVNVLVHMKIFSGNLVLRGRVT